MLKHMILRRKHKEALLKTGFKDNGSNVVAKKLYGGLEIMVIFVKQTNSARIGILKYFYTTFQNSKYIFFKENATTKEVEEIYYNQTGQKLNSNWNNDKSPDDIKI